MQKTIDEHEAAGTTDDEAYSKATMAYVTHWICGLDLPWPDHVMRSMNNLGEDVYRTMQGPGWNVTGDLQTGKSPNGLENSTCPCLSHPVGTTR